MQGDFDLKVIWTLKQSWCLNIGAHCSAFPMQLRPSKDKTSKVRL